MIFEKSSTRTRMSFDVGMQQLGGRAISISAQDMQLGRGESVEDTARALSGYVDAIMIRAKSHDTLLALSAAAKVPVVNGLTDQSHPCQIMADMLTIEERFGRLKGLHMAWMGDANNVARSVMHAAEKFEFHLTLGCPKPYAPSQSDLNAWTNWVEDPVEAVQNADVVMTDTWVSMGQEEERLERLTTLAPYQVNEELMAHASKDVLFLHCLPAHRSEEVSAAVIDGPQSGIWDQAENRLHAQKAILRWCLNV
jgi:ornithine carbamoyltransferase